MITINVFENNTDNSMKQNLLKVIQNYHGTCIIVIKHGLPVFCES